MCLRTIDIAGFVTRDPSSQLDFALFEGQLFSCDLCRAGAILLKFGSQAWQLG
jgi:hypothetical protein